MKKSLVAVALLSVCVIGFSGCGEEDESSNGSLYPEKATIVVNSLEVESNGAQLKWNVSIKNEHKSTTVEIVPWNDTTYFAASLGQDYNDRVKLDCNKEVGNNGYISCNDIDSIICTRGMMGSNYSEFTCNYTINGGVIVPQYKKKMRVSTISNDDEQNPTLLNIGTRYYYEVVYGSIVEEDSKNVFNLDESKMYNVYTNGMGQI